jgi:predicted adenine nucleotide alpha hydrolase (AANH) superfamily ATPase
MQHIAKKDSRYGFEQHKWYGTQMHRTHIITLGLSKYHRVWFCGACIEQWATIPKSLSRNWLAPSWWSSIHPLYSLRNVLKVLLQWAPTRWKVKPGLLLHICCGPDLTRPLHRLKNHFKLYLFWYNPNIHPRKEHTKRYAQFIKLVGLEKWDYEIIENRYDPKEFFKAMITQKGTIKSELKNADNKTVLTVAWEMPERSDRCNPCYSMRLDQAALQAVKHDISYFSSTLLISPKKHGGKLFDRWVEAQERHGSKFLWFDFAKNEWYTNAVHLTRKHKLRRQQYCGCGWTIPKPGEKRQTYTGG